MSQLNELIKPEVTEIVTLDGEKRRYYISRLPAIVAREIITQYVPTAMPKIGDYKTNEMVMLKLMSFVAVESSEGKITRLVTRELIDNHVPDFETLAKIEFAMMDYNTSFFKDGKVSGFFEGLTQKATGLITKMLTDLLEQSSAKDKQP